jgi:hypothetical protein
MSDKLFIETPPGAPGEKDELHRLVTGLLQERFAIENDFAQLTLDKIDHVLEETAPMFENTEVVPAEINAQKKSYERCKDTYCLILLHLESKGGKLPTDVLSDLVAQISPKAPVAARIALSANLPPLFENAPMAPSIALEEVPVVQPAPVELGMTQEWKVSDDDTPTLPMKEISDLAIRNALPDPIPEAEEFGCRSTLASQYLKLAHHFRADRDPRTFPFQAEVADRLVMFSLCFAVEAECIERLSPVIPIFWSNREDAIRGLLDNEGKRFDLHPSLKRALDELAAQHSDWLYDHQFPHAGVLNSLRYMVATSSPGSFKPTAIETASLLLFFGHDAVLGAFPAANLLGARGLSVPQLIELVFRLCRIQKFKNRVVTAGTNFDPEQLKLLEQDVHESFLLLMKLEFDQSDGLLVAAS